MQLFKKRSRLFSWLRRKTKILGYFFFALNLGLMDSIFQWALNSGGIGCYQFPYTSGIGCLDVQHSEEVVFILLMISAGMIGVGA